MNIELQYAIKHTLDESRRALYAPEEKSATPCFDWKQEQLRRIQSGLKAVRSAVAYQAIQRPQAGRRLVGIKVFQGSKGWKTVTAKQLAARLQPNQPGLMVGMLARPIYE